MNGVFSEDETILKKLQNWIVLNTGTKYIKINYLYIKKVKNHMNQERSFLKKLITMDK